MLRLMEEMCDRGHKTILISARPFFSQGEQLATSAEQIVFRSPFIRYIAIRRKWIYPLPAIGVLLDGWLFAIRAWGILKCLRKVGRCDVIFLTGFPRLGARIERRLGIPVVVRMPGPPDSLDRGALEKVSAVVANGDAYKQIKKRSLKRLYNIPPGIAPMFFVQRDVESRYPSHRVMLFVGRFTRIKNLSFLLEVVSRVKEIVPDVLLVLVGGGEMKVELERRVKKLDIAKWVTFVNPTYGEALADMYRGADLFVLSSFYDNFPNVINEAMASGLPVVATDVGGVSLQVDDGQTGYLVSSGDVEMFCERVIDLLSHSDKRTLFGARAREKVKGVTWGVAGETFERALRDVV